MSQNALIGQSEMWQAAGAYAIGQNLLMKDTADTASNSLILASSVMLHKGIALGVASLAAIASAACNGFDEFCSRKYSNVSLVGAHDSYAVGSAAADNQNNDVTKQLQDGIRLLQVQGHSKNGEIHLCHTSCDLEDSGTATDYFQKVKSFLDSNKNEVVTFVIVNNDEISPSTWANSFESAGLSDMAYSPNNPRIAYDDWPTYQDLISQEKRVVAFLAQGAGNGSVPYLIDEFTNVWETPFDETDSSFPCSVDRGSNDNTMYLMNHFLDKNSSIFGIDIQTPDKDSLSTTNSFSSLISQANACSQLQGYYPTFTLVDFYDQEINDIFKYSAQINSVKFTPKDTSSSSSSSSSAPASSSSGVTSSPLSSSSPDVPIAYLASVAVAVVLSAALCV